MSTARGVQESGGEERLDDEDKKRNKTNGNEAQSRIIELGTVPCCLGDCRVESKTRDANIK